MKTVLDGIIRKLIMSEIINYDDREIYEYGLNQLLVILLNLITLCVIGIWFDNWFLLVIFVGTFVPLRSFTGGYHASSARTCFLWSIAILILLSIIDRRIINVEVNLFSIAFLCNLIIFILAPIQDSNKPLDYLERRIFRKRAILILLANNLLFLLGVLIGNSYGALIQRSLIYTLLMVTFLMSLGQVKNMFLSKVE